MNLSRAGLAVFVLAAAATGGEMDATRAGGPQGLVIVANKGDHTVSILDPASGARLAVIEETGVTGHELAVSPDGRRAYVPIYGDAGVGRPGSDGRTIDVIDLEARKRIATVDLGAPLRPHHPVFGPDGRLYVTTELSETISVLDPKTHAVVDRLPTGQKESHMVALSPDGRRAYTSNAHAGTVSVIDVPGRKVVAVIPISPYAQRITLSTDGRRAFTADQTEPRLAVIDTVTNTVERWVPLPGIAYGTVPTPDGKHLLVTLIRANQVAALDLATFEVARTLDVPKAPQEVILQPDGAFAYVSCDAAGQVAVLDVLDWKVVRLIDSGPLADGLAWAPAPAR